MATVGAANSRRHFVGNPRDDAEFKCLIAPSAKGPFRVYSILPRSVILLTILLDFACSFKGKSRN